MRSLDLRGLRCPLPVLRTKKALGGLRPGERLAVLSDDPLAGVDIPNLVRQLGDELLSVERLDLGWACSIRRRSD